MKLNRLNILFVGAMIVMLGLSTTPVASTTNPGKSSDLVLRPAAQQAAPVFYGIAPEASMYGYFPGTEVEISYLTLTGDTPWLMGSGNGLDWSTGAAFNSSSTFNSTHTLWTVNITVNEAGEFKARNADDATGTNAIWENHPDGPFSNWQLKVIGAPVPEIDRIDGASLLSGNTYFAPAGTNVTIVASMVNVHNASADLYLVGDLSLLGGAVWDINNKSFPLTYYDYMQVDANINVTYYAITITMPDGSFEFKIGSQGDWAKSQSGSNYKLTSIELRMAQPALYDVEGATMENARDDANNVGATYRANVGDTVKIWYRIYTLGTCDSSCKATFDDTMAGITMELQGDDAGQSLAWNANDGQLPFTLNGTMIENLTMVANITGDNGGTFNGYTNITNAAVAYFYIDYTIPVETVQFKGYYYDGTDRWEGASFSANNLLVAGMVWTSDIVGDVYNVGQIQLKFMASYAPDNANETDIIGFGIWDGANWNEYNYTGYVPGPVNGNWTFVLSINLQDDAPNTNLIAGQGGNIQVILYHHDLGLNETVKQYDPQGSNDFTPLDGIPLVSVTAEEFQGADVSVSYTASGADSYVDSVSIDWGDGSTEDATDFTSGTLTHTYSADGKYTIAVTATTSAGGSTTVSVDVTVDSTKPTAAIESPADGSNVSGLVVSFEYSFSDDGGVKSATLDFGDGNSQDVSGTTSVIHEYASAGTYTAKLTVVDNAGNEAVVEVTFTILADTGSTSETGSDTSTSAGGLPIDFSMVFLALLSFSMIAIYRRRS